MGHDLRIVRFCTPQLGWRKVKSHRRKCQILRAHTHGIRANQKLCFTRDIFIESGRARVQIALECTEMFYSSTDKSAVRVDFGFADVASATTVYGICTHSHNKQWTLRRMAFAFFGGACGMNWPIINSLFCKHTCNAAIEDVYRHTHIHMHVCEPACPQSPAATAQNTHARTHARTQTSHTIASVASLTRRAKHEHEPTSSD